jgi:hypothetical protein
VDDPAQVIAMRDLFASHGPFGGFVTRVGELAAGDLKSGVFRPLAWLYPPMLYWLPVRGAHLIRLLMVIIIIVGPLIYFRRQGATKGRLCMTLCLLVAGAATLYQGLLLLSLQEVGGMALVSLGLGLSGQRSRTVAFTLAALFKGPFSWLLLGNSIMLWREGRRRLAVTNAAIGIAVLLTNVIWSKSGVNTGGYKLNLLDPELWHSAGHILEPTTMILLVSFAWWLVVTQSAPQRRADFPFFAVAAFGYYAQMVPWSITAYYLGPISFLFALVLASLLPDPPALKARTWVVGLLVPALVAAWLAKDALTFVFRTNAIMAESSECLSQQSNSTVVVFGDWLYVTSSEEGPIRIAENTQLSHPQWRGQLSPETNSESVFNDPSTTHALTIGPVTLPSSRPVRPLCTGSLVTLYALG